MDLIGPVGCGRSHTVQVDASCQDLSMVVVRVVSADLCTASGGEQIHVCIFKGLDKALHYMEIPVFIFLHMILSVHFFQEVLCLPAVQLL